MTAAVASIAFVGGACIGSFINVVAYRLPRGESLVRPRSRCPHCGTQIATRDNVPLLSWLWLRGRCRRCGAEISPRYPLVELTTAIAFAAVVLARGVHSGLALQLVFVAVLVCVSAIDLEHHIIPNRIVAPAAVVAVALTAALEPGELVERLVAGAAAGGLLLLAVLAYPRGMGMGDVKLAALMGLCLGRAVAPALLIGFASGTAVGLAILARWGSAARKQALPFAPFLAFGGFVGVLAGDQIVDWYSDQFL